MTSVVITRGRHPLQGQALRLLGQMRRHGRLELLLVLPDGSKSLIPAVWTDLDEAEGTGAAGEAGQAATTTLGTLTDLLHTVAVVSALSTRTRQTKEQAAQPSPLKEDNRAAHPAQSATRPDTSATPYPPRSTPRPAGHRGDHAAGPLDRQNRESAAGRTDRKAGGR